MSSARWSPVTKRLVIVGLAILLLLGLYFTRGLLPPFAISVVLAYLLKPIVDFLERRARFPRLLATILVFLVVLVLLSNIPLTVIPYLVNQVTRITRELQGLVGDFAAFLARPVTFLEWSFRPQDLFGDVPATLQRWLQPAASQTVSLLFGVASSLAWLIAILVIAFYLVKDGGRLREFLDRNAPPGYGDEWRKLREQMNSVWRSFFRGQLLLGLIVGVAVWIAMMVVGLPNAGLMGFVAGVLEAIPNFGPILATIPAALIAFFRGSTYLPLDNFWFMVLVLACYGLIQQVENAYLVPRIMGRRMRLHPVLVFIGVLVGGYLFGILGVFLAAPLLGTLRILAIYVYAKLLDQDPFPAPAEELPAELYAGEIDAILLDLDGTLVETDDQAVEALARRLRPIRRLLPGRDAERAARRLLMRWEVPTTRLLSLMDRLGLDDNVFEVVDRVRRLGGVHSAARFVPVDGVAEALRELSRRYRLAIVTTRRRADAEAFVAQQELVDLVQAVVGREDTWRLKPHPAPVRHAAKLLDVPLDRCMFVGDTTADVAAARAAGARSVGVLCGFGYREDLERAGADLILNSTAELTSHF